VDSLDRLPTVVATSRVEQGTERALLLDAVEIRDLEIGARPEGALSDIADIPEGVLVSTHVAGQAVLSTSVAPNRVAAPRPRVRGHFGAARFSTLGGTSSAHRTHRQCL
jgi:hypothetical protein